MKIDTVGYLAKEGIVNTLENKKTTIASFFIILATMIMLGIFVLLTRNIENIVGKALDEQGIQVYLKTSVTQEKINEIENQIKNIYSVKSTQFVSSEEGLKMVIEGAEDQYKDLYTGFEEDNPIPPSFTVKLEDLQQSANVQNEIMKIDGVDDITSKDATTETIVNIAKVVNVVIAVILVVLLCISVFIISNTIKITMYARRKEISIMKYVGATDGFIRMPFIIEGMLIGLFGAAVSTAIVGATYSYIYARYLETTSNAAGMLNSALVPFSSVSQTLIILYVILGVGIGMIGSTMSIKKYLDV